MSIDTIVRRAIANHIVVQGREEALRELLSEDAAFSTALDPTNEQVDAAIASIPAGDEEPNAA
jgi:hypothetical protein